MLTRKTSRLVVVALAGAHLFACGPVARPPVAPDPAALEREVARELDDFHAAAAAADEERYFAHFAARGVFLGTDATERWDVPAFRAYAHPYFAKGKGWRYVPGRRAITISAAGDVAWFDEELDNAHLGKARGSGVLVREDGRLRVAQYNLTVPIPNEQMDAVIELMKRPPPVAGAPLDLEAMYKKAYDAATAAAAADPLEAAATALLAVVPEAKRHPDQDTEFWLHNELTWVRWAQAARKGDQTALSPALAEVDAARDTMDHAALPEAKRTALRLHELWDRAYLELEVASQAPVAGRARALAAARAAKAAYDTLASANHDSDGMAVLDAFFLTKTGRAKEAAAAARRVDVDQDEDLQDLYVIARAFDANGERAAADRVLARICGGRVYLMKPLIVRELARDGRTCPRS